MDGIDIEKAIAGLKDGTLIATPSDYLQQLKAELRQTKEENERLKKDLLKYGMHLDDCPCYIPPGKWNENYHRTKTIDELNIKEVKGGYTVTLKCTCGFDQALKESGGAAET